MTQPKTSTAQLDAVKRYERKATKLQVVFNVVSNKEETAINAAIDKDSEPFSTLVKRLLTEHYSKQ